MSNNKKKSQKKEGKYWIFQFYPIFGLYLKESYQSKKKAKKSIKLAKHIQPTQKFIILKSE